MKGHSRIALVLGAGGVLGAAWIIGALPELQDRVRRPLGDLDLIVGTSAGSVLAAALRCGVTVKDLVAHQRGETVPGLHALGPPDLGCSRLPPWPRLGVGSPRLLLEVLRSPFEADPWVAASALLPRGTADHACLEAAIEAMLKGAERHGTTSAGKAWAASGSTWIVAVDYDTGRRVVFGTPGAPRASLPQAVTASCSVPGWYRPIVIGGRRYVDGGVRSATSADLLARAELDEVYVLAPAASLKMGRARTPLERVEQFVRRRMTAMLNREVGVLRGSGAKVCVLTPGPADLAAMGGNLMDPSRRQAVLETALRTSTRTFVSTLAA